MSTSLLSGISGLSTHQEMINIVANNIANANTAGFKTRRAMFADLMYRTLSDPAGPTASSGSSDAAQIGMGTQVSRIAVAHVQGNLSPSDQPLDLALDGEGFFVLDDNGQDVYTRVGSFSLDQNGYLVDPTGGLYVKRFGQVGEGGDGSGAVFQTPNDSRIQIPLGRVIPGEATSEISMIGNLDSATPRPEEQLLQAAFPMTEGAVNATGATLINDLDSNEVDYTTGDSINIVGTDSDGSPINSSIPVDGTTTIADLETAVQALFSNATVSFEDGKLMVEADGTGESLLSLTFSDATGNMGRTNLQSHRMIEVRPGRDGGIVSNTLEVFDEFGNTHGITINMQRIDNHTWSLSTEAQSETASIIAGEIAEIEFATNGAFLTSGGIPEITVQLTEDGPQQTIRINFGTVGAFDGLSQAAAASSLRIEQDGDSAGVLTSLNVSGDGTIMGVASNGNVWAVAQLAIAQFQNTNGLEAIGDTDFISTLSSGEPSIGTGGAAGRGVVRAASIEGSNVDLAQEFTRLIVAQRGFSANARTVTVTEEILEEVTNLIR